MASPWSDEFPNDNPDLFTASEYPPAIPDEDYEIEVIEAFDDAEFAHAVIESMPPPPIEEEPVVEARVEEEPVVEAPVSHIALAEQVEVEESAPPASEDAGAWDQYVDVMREVAMMFGAARDVAQGLALTLEADAVARAWRVAIEGGEADFTACGNAMLDEWSAGFLAQITQSALDPIRRELRSRGVCAFGLIAA